LTKNKKRLLAIGDGGNDVAMIQEAHVGVGIVGKEGKQASLSADYSINNFKDLKLLLLWFGRISYKNTATIAHFVIHRGLIISFLELIFIILFYCVPIALYNGNLMVGYSTIYTALPVISLIFDEDTTVGNVIKFPSIYKDLQKGRQLSTKTFLGWFWKSLFQSSIIMLSGIFFFEHSFMKISTVTFTCLILAELLNVYTEINKFHYVMYLSLALTFTSYIFSLWFLNSVLDLSYLDFNNIFKIIIVTFFSWIPFYLLKKLMSCIYPETHEKLNILKEEE
jgi:phospholipid-translocating ATPase